MGISMRSSWMKLPSAKILSVYVLFCFLLVVNIAFWLATHRDFSKWGNVPPAPSAEGAGVPGLGDAQAAYRMYGYFLQNLGNTGGDYQSLKDYDYKSLETWFFLENTLNDRSDFVPVLAAYYFGAVDNEPEKIAHIVNYLSVAGEAPYPEKWRWLAQAVYHARYNEKNDARALALAEKLAALDRPMAAWARQMPAFIQLQMGNKQAAYEIMMRILITGRDTMHPNEINFMRDFICTRVLDKASSQKDPLCANIP